MTQIKIILISMNNENLKKEWCSREKRFGNTKRAVLFKRFPRCLNSYIHNKHMNFIFKNLPLNCSTVLDVGCGYGRVSKELKKQNASISFTGIELCEKFANTYKNEIGQCFVGSIQDFKPTKTFDTIIIITLLMYLSDSERTEAINKLWGCLKNGGVIICIEPAIEFINLWKTFTRKQNASPTGGNVRYFTMKELQNLFPKNIKASTTIHLFPFLKPTSLHYGLVITKSN